MSINSQRFDDELERKFLKAMEEARFLFGDDLHDYLETLRKDILTVRDIDRIGPPTNAAKRDEAMSHINKFYEVGQAKFSNSRPRSWARKLVKIFKPMP